MGNGMLLVRAEVIMRVSLISTEWFKMFGVTQYWKILWLGKCVRLYKVPGGKSQLLRG